MTKVLASLLVAIFVVSLTAVAVSAEPSMVKEKKMAVNNETNKSMNMTNVGMKKMAVNSETNKSMNMTNMDMKKMEVKNNDMNCET